jgi:hypothetical protein
MNKMTAALLALPFAIAAASPAMAATALTLNPGPNGTQSVGFDKTIATPGSFSETFTFTLPSAGTTSASLVTIAVNRLTNIDFTSATLNGNAFTFSPTGTFEFGSANGISTMAGLQTLVVNGVSGGNGSFGGNISFAPAGGAIPEPATWALMILGFGLVGGMMRRRAGTPANVNVRFA